MSARFWRGSRILPAWLREVSHRLKLMVFDGFFKKLTAQKPCRRVFELMAFSKSWQLKNHVGAFLKGHSDFTVPGDHSRGITIWYALLISNAGFYRSRTSLKGGLYLIRPSDQQCWFLPRRSLKGGLYLIRPSNQQCWFLPRRSQGGALFDTPF